MIINGEWIKKKNHIKTRKDEIVHVINTNDNHFEPLFIEVFDRAINQNKPCKAAGQDGI